MATSTTRMNLIKPDGTDKVDVDDLNTNFDKIDTAYGSAPLFANTTDRDAAFLVKAFYLCFIGANRNNATPYVYRNGTWTLLGGGQAGPGLPQGGAVGEVPIKQSATDYDIAWGSFPGIFPWEYTNDNDPRPVGPRVVYWIWDGVGSPVEPINADPADLGVW